MKETTFPTHKTFSGIRVYFTPVDRPLSQAVFDHLLQLLPPDNQERNRRFRRWQDRHTHLYTRMQLIEGVRAFGGSNDPLSEIQYDDHGRPFIPGKVNFSISHSDGYAICAVGNAMRVGVDTELWGKIDVDEYRDTMDQDQWRDIISASDPTFLFLAYWTKKEAVIKADGRGLSFPLNKIRFEDGMGLMEDSKWFMHEVNISPRCHTWLACDKENVEIELIEYFPDKQRPGAGGEMPDNCSHCGDPHK